MKATVHRLSAFILRPSRSQFLWLVFFGALLIRLAIVGIAGNPQKPEMYEHGDIAHNLYAGHGFAMQWPYESLDSTRRHNIADLPPDHEGAFIPPLNPYLIYSFYTVFGETATAILFLMIVYAILSALVPVVTYKTASLFTNELGARYTGLISMFFLPAAYAVVTFSGSPIYQILGVAIFYYAIRLIRFSKISDGLLLGLLCGLMTMSRSEFFILGFILIAIASVSMGNASIGRRLRVAVLSAGCALLMIAPWTIRNYRLFDRFIPVVSHPWYEIWRGNNEFVAGGGLTDRHTYIWINPQMFPGIVHKMDAITYDRYFEVKVNDVFKSETIAFTTANIGSSIILSLKKLLFLFTIDLSDHSAYNPINILCAIPITISIILGFFYTARRRSKQIWWLFMVTLIYYIGITISTFVLPRYQSYIQTLLLPVSAMWFGYSPLIRPNEQ